MESEGSSPRHRARVARSSTAGKLDRRSASTRSSGRRATTSSRSSPTSRSSPATPARWLHRGMTSSDVLDTASRSCSARAIDEICGAPSSCSSRRSRRACREHRTTPHDRPLARHPRRADHLRRRLRRPLRRGAAAPRAPRARAREAIAVGKIAGAVGTYAHLTPQIEATRARARSAFSPRRSPRRSSPRDRHAALFSRWRCSAPRSSASRPTSATGSAPRSARPRSASARARRARARCRTSGTRSSRENLCGLARIVRA